MSEEDKLSISMFVLGDNPSLLEPGDKNDVSPQPHKNHQRLSRRTFSVSNIKSIRTDM